MATTLYKYDIPSADIFVGDIAVDTEAMGLNCHRDRLCAVQIGDGKGNAYVVHFPTPEYSAPNLKKLLSRLDIIKIFHFARFDIAILHKYLGITISNIYCTKIASRLTRTYTDCHGLKDLCAELLGIKISKQQQSSNWGAVELSKEQIEYAASDVLYLHDLRKSLDELLERAKRSTLAQETFAFLPTRALLDLAGWIDVDIFAH